MPSFLTKNETTLPAVVKGDGQVASQSPYSMSSDEKLETQSLAEPILPSYFPRRPTTHSVASSCGQPETTPYVSINFPHSAHSQAPTGFPTRVSASRFDQQSSYNYCVPQGSGNYVVNGGNYDHFWPYPPH